jgi:hypothetical protein
MRRIEDESPEVIEVLAVYGFHFVKEAPDAIVQQPSHLGVVRPAIEIVDFLDRRQPDRRMLG